MTVQYVILLVMTNVFCTEGGPPVSQHRRPKTLQSDYRLSDQTDEYPAEITPASETQN